MVVLRSAFPGSAWQQFCRNGGFSLLLLSVVRQERAFGVAQWASWALEGVERLCALCSL